MRKHHSLWWGRTYRTIELDLNYKTTVFVLRRMQWSFDPDLETCTLIYVYVYYSFNLYLFIFSALFFFTYFRTHFLPRLKMGLNWKLRTGQNFNYQLKNDEIFLIGSWDLRSAIFNWYLKISERLKHNCMRFHQSYPDPLPEFLDPPSSCFARVLKMSVLRICTCFFMYAIRNLCDAILNFQLSAILNVLSFDNIDIK